jgi:tetratricopeptide (TPR) repeat protein
MHHHDIRGLAVTARTPEAVRQLDLAVADFLNYGTGASTAVKDALVADPDCALAQVYRGYLLMMLENRAVFPKIQAALDALGAVEGSLNGRERLHVRALQAWVKGDIAAACLAWERLLIEYPHDIMALKLHHTMAFYTGRSNVLRSVVSGVIGAWDDTVAGYSHVQGMYAYALEECGEYAEAERWGRAAAERNPDDLWAIHSVAHVMEMQGRHAEGVAWLDYSPEEWARKNFFKAHVWWHAALFSIAQEDYARALALFDNELSNLNSDSYVDVSNQASLLKRLEIAGIDVGERWNLLAAHSETRINDHILPFRDAHYCLALAAGGNFDAARRQIDALFAFSRQGQGWTAEATRSTLIPLCEAMIAYEAGQHARACDLLWPMRNELSPIGGSLAQRDLFAQILIDAAVKGGRLGMARSLLSERVAKFPTARRNWTQYARVLADLDKPDAARRAEGRARAVGSLTI